MSNIPTFIDELKGDGDGFNYPWIVRVDRTGNQYLYDLMNEWGTDNKSEMLRGCISFVAKYLPKISEQEGQKVGSIIAARAELMSAMSASWRRKDIHNEVKSAYMEAMAQSHEPTRKRLLDAAEKYAKLNDIEWPPTGIDLLQYDTDAHYIHGRVLSLLQQTGKPKVSLRDLVANSVGGTEHILATLKKLEVAEHIILEEEKRSGPMTVWVSVPTLVMNC